jgi:hypothetical protein
MSRYKTDPLDLKRVTTYPLASRQSKVTVGDFARPVNAAGSLTEFLDGLPNILAGREIKELGELIREARRRERAVIAGLGGHVIKTGLSPVLIDLMKRGFVTAFAMNGSALIHDFEIALTGATSEDVDASLGSGSFGGAEETGRIINEALTAGAADNIGAGEAIGRKLAEIAPPHAEKSILACAWEARVPVTVHVALGTDIVHIHPSADGGATGQTSHRDFRLLCSLVRDLNDGGVYLNLGSAVVLPEVFLKTVTVVRNLGEKLESFTTANFDFIQHYRPLTNVVRRPVAASGRGFSFTGHHELMIPLLAACILGD